MAASVSTYAEILKDWHATMGMSESEAAKFHLIQRYRDQVSPRLVKEAERLFEVGTRRANELLLEALRQPLPFLAKQPDSWCGALIVPFGSV